MYYKYPCASEPLVNTKHAGVFIYLDTLVSHTFKEPERLFVLH